MAKKKVALVIISDPEIYPPTINAANYLAEKGFDVYLYGIKYPLAKDRAKINSDIQLFYFGHHQTGIRNLIQFFFIIFKLSIDSLTNKYNWIISYDPFSVLPAYVATAISRAKWNYHQHDFWEKPIGLFQKILYHLEYKLGSKADLISFPQKHRAELFKERSGLKEMPLINYNGPRLNWIKPEVLKIHSKLAELKKVFPFILIYQGGISKYFCLNQLILSIRYCSNSFCLILLGKELELGIKKDLMDLASQNNIDNRVFFWEDYIPYDNLPSVTSFCDIGIAKLTHHQMDAPVNDRFLAGASNKLIEYMACSLPIISSNTEDNISFFAMDEIGLLCDPTSPPDIARVIDQLLSDEILRKKISSDNANQFRLKYNFDKQFEKVFEFINKN